MSSCFGFANLHLTQDIKYIKTLYVLNFKFVRGNINIYLHFVSFLLIDTTQLVEILLHIRQ